MEHVVARQPDKKEIRQALLEIAKPARFNHEFAELVHLIAQKWTRAYTLADVVGLERPSRPVDWAGYVADPQLAVNVATLTRPPGGASDSRLVLEALQLVADVGAAIGEVCSNWELPDEGADWVWWTYERWPLSMSAPPLLAVTVDRRTPDSAAVLQRLKVQQRARDRWVSYVLRRRTGAGRPKGTTGIPKDEYPTRKAEAIKSFTARIGRAPNAAELWSELGIDKATYYRYEERARSRRISHEVILSADNGV